MLVRVTGRRCHRRRRFCRHAPQGAGPVTLSSVSEVTLTNGSGYAVYEVAAANPNVQETAQFPTFISLPRLTPPAVAQETIALAPGLLRDHRFGHRTGPALRRRRHAERLHAARRLRPSRRPAPSSSLESNAHPDQRGRRRWRHDQCPRQIPGPQPGRRHAWIGPLSIIYQPRHGLARLRPTSGHQRRHRPGHGPTPRLSPPESILATIIVNGGSRRQPECPRHPDRYRRPRAAASPVAPTVVVSQVLNAATLQAAPLVPGSLATLMGSHLSGKSVAVTFDGTPATLLYTGDTQINLQVPAALGLQDLRQPGGDRGWREQHAPDVPLAAAWPAVFPHGVLNQDNQENTPTSAAKSGDILQIFATGIPKLATVSVQIGDRKDLVPLYAG